MSSTQNEIVEVHKESEKVAEALLNRNHRVLDLEKVSAEYQYYAMTLVISAFCGTCQSYDNAAKRAKGAVCMLGAAPTKVYDFGAGEMLLSVYPRDPYSWAGVMPVCSVSGQNIYFPRVDSFGRMLTPVADGEFCPVPGKGIAPRSPFTTYKDNNKIKVGARS